MEGLEYESWTKLYSCGGKTSAQEILIQYDDLLDSRMTQENQQERVIGVAWTRIWVCKGHKQLSTRSVRLSACMGDWFWKALGDTFAY